MSELRGRVYEIQMRADFPALKVRARFPGLDGKAVDVDFTIGTGHGLATEMQAGVRVYLNEPAAGVHPYVTFPGSEFPEVRVPVDDLHTRQATPESGNPYRDSWMRDEGAPPMFLVNEANRVGEAMGFSVSFGPVDGVWMILVHVPGRGATKHRKEPDDTWEETMMRAGLLGTL